MSNVLGGNVLGGFSGAATGPVYFPDGTAALPSISRASDHTDGIYFGADFIGFAVDGTGRGAVDDIGTWAFGSVAFAQQATVEIKGLSASKPQIKLIQDNAADDGWLFNCDGPNGGHLSFLRRTAGASTEMLRLGTTGILTPQAQVNLKSFAVATLPSAGTAGGLIYVSDETGGAVVAFSDGTDWRRVTDRAVVS